MASFDLATIWLKRRESFIEHRGLEGVFSDADGKGQHPRINHKRIEELEHNIPMADKDALYAKELTIDLTTIKPFVSGPNTVKTYAAVSEVKEKDIKINKAYLVSCVNSRVDDIAEAAAEVQGKKIADHVKFYIAAASSEVQKEAERYGYWQSLLEAGAIPLPPGCGPCIGLWTGFLEDGRVEGLARGADLLVSEVIDLDRIAAQWRQNKDVDPNYVEGLIAHLAEDHLSPEEVGKLAARAGVQRVVLTHLVPGWDEETGPDIYSRGVTQQFDGPVHVANDLGRF